MKSYGFMSMENHMDAKRHQEFRNLLAETFPMVNDHPDIAGLLRNAKVSSSTW